MSATEKEEHITAGEPAEVEERRAAIQAEIDAGLHPEGTRLEVRRHLAPGATTVYLLQFTPQVPASAAKAAPAKRKRAPKAKAAGELVLFHSHAANAFFGGIYDSAAADFLPDFPLAKLTTRDARAHLCAMAGRTLPPVEAIPPGTFHFTPGQKPQLARTASGYCVNTWREPPLRAKAVRSVELPAAVRQLLLHVMGNCATSLSRFVNWLAVAYQFNCRTDTAWIWSGVEGTGKGIAFNEIIKPLFGAEYCPQLLVETLEDRFNPWAESCVMLNVDECDLADRRQKSTREKVRTLVTGETVSVRGMHVAAREVPNHCNVILTSNCTVVSELPRSDRRFNVSPPQMQPLGGDTDALVAAIRAELPALAGYLRDYPADRQMARTAMASAAKAQMIEAGETTPKAFANALRGGDLDWFLSQYFTVTDGAPLANGAMAAALARWVGHAEGGSASPLFVSTAEVTACYNGVLGEALKLSPVGVGRFLTGAGMPGIQERSGARRRGYYVAWRLAETPTPEQRRLLALPERDRQATETAWLALDSTPVRMAA